MNKHIAAVLCLGTTLQAGYALDASSPTIRSGAQLPQEHVASGFGCSGMNQSPAVRWSDAPKHTRSFAITLYDPDAPTGSGWWHWVVFNIPPSATEIKANASATASLPEGSIEVRNDASNIGYMGACPPRGSRKHRYLLKVWALKDTVPLNKNASPAMVGFYLNTLQLQSATITAVYGH